MKETTTNLNILLPVYNRRIITEKIIDCLVAQSFSNFHLILIDDGSTDGTSEMVKAKIGNLTILKGVGDWWWAGSLQQGIDWLKRNAVDEKDVVLFMNDDVLFDVKFLETSINLLSDRYEMLLPQVINQQTGKIEESGVHADLKKLTFATAGSPDQINCLPTRGLFMRMSTLRKVGNFYPTLLPHYLSDYEFTIRANRKGVNLITSSQILVYYDGVASGYQEYDGLSTSEFARRIFSIRSRLNPIYWTTFILLSSPYINAPWLILRVWLVAIKAILVNITFSNAK